MKLIQLLLGTFLFVNQLALAQTPWPNYISQLEHDTADSAVLAALPTDVAIQLPSTSVSADKARWSGTWTGWACASRRCDLKLVVESITADGAVVVYADALPSGQFSKRIAASFNGAELTFPVPSGMVSLRFRMGNSGIVEYVLHKDGAMRIAGVLSKAPVLTKVTERIPTRLVENGKPVSLEMVIFKPQGNGPFPALMFNHGSTGTGENPALFTSTYSSASLARFFTDKGWLVAFPQRRGRGKSDGLYDEGFEENRSRYSCTPALSLPGLDRALTDIDAAADYLASRPDVDSKRMLIGGQSRGGIASVAYVGSKPARFVGVINFVGGWVGDRCVNAESINTNGFQRGASFAPPTLWLYAENDPFYRVSHSKNNFDAFVKAGGKGAFRVHEAARGISGHSLISLPDLWQSDVAAYLDQLGLR